nr:skin secretory protein xP2-like [Aegilops tauschii subsp. strangulata]
MLTADSPPARPSPAAGTISTTSPRRQGGVPSPEEAAAPAPAPPKLEAPPPRHLPRQPPATAGEVARGPGRPQPPPPAGPPAPDLAGPTGAAPPETAAAAPQEEAPRATPPTMCAAAQSPRRRTAAPRASAAPPRARAVARQPGEGEGRGNEAPPPLKPAGLCPLALAGGGEWRRREGGRGEPAARVSPASLAGAAGVGGPKP